MTNRVVFVEIVCQVFPSFFPEYAEIIFSYSVAHLIKSHFYCSGYCLFGCSIHYYISAVLSVSTVIGVFWRPIYARPVRMDVAFRQFSNPPPNYSPVAHAMTFLMIPHSTCTRTFSGGIDIIGVLLLYFGPRKKIHLLCYVPLVMRGGMHLNRCVGSYCFSYTL